MAEYAGELTSKDLESSVRLDAVALLTVYVILLMTIPSSLVFGPLGAAGGPATLFAAALMLPYLAMRVGQDSGTNNSQPVRVAGVVFLYSILASYASANLHFLPKIEQNGSDVGIISAVGWLAILLVAADGIDQVDRLKTLLSRVVTAAAGLALIGIAQFFTGVNYTRYIVIPGLTFDQAPTDLIIRGGFNRPTATTAQPLEFAAALLIVFPIAIHQARFAADGQRLWRWIRVIIIGIVMPMTVSRTATIGLVVMTAVLVPTWPKIHRRYAYAVMSASGLLLLLLFPRLLSTFATLVAQIFTGSASTDSRSTGIGLAMPYIAQHPWFGSGFGTFPPQIYFFTDDQYLDSLITTGVVGLCCLIGIFLTGWFVARSLRRRSLDDEVRDLAQCLAAVVAVATACFGTFDALSFASAAGLTFLLLGCTGAAFRLLSQA